MRRVLWLPLIGCASVEPAQVRAVGTDARFPVLARFDAGEVVVATARPGAPEVGISLAAWSGASALGPATSVTPERRGGRSTYDHGGLVEWWERGPAGLQQGFVVDDPPPSGSLVLELAVRGAAVEVDPDRRSATLRPRAGGPIRYEGLAA